MYNNNIVNFQESTTILNACTKKSGNLLKAPRIYIYIYIYIEECIFRQQVVIKATFIKDDGTLFIFYCNFSSVLVIFLVSGSMW